MVQVVDEKDRYNVAGCVDRDGCVERMKQPEEKAIEFIIPLIKAEVQQSNARKTTWPGLYNHKEAAKTIRILEITSYQYLDLVDGELAATAKGARILVGSGLALAMSKAYCCARMELRKTRGNPTFVRDAFESAQRMFAQWTPILYTLETTSILEEIFYNIKMDGEEDEDLDRTKIRITTKAAPTAL